MKLDLNREELQRLSGEILSLLRMTGLSYFSENPTERAAEKESVSYLDTDSGKRYFDETYFPPRDGYDFPPFDVDGEGEYSFLQTGDINRSDSEDTDVNALGFFSPEVRGTDVLQRRRDMESASDYFRKDSRRYDGKLEKY